MPTDGARLLAEGGYIQSVTLSNGKNATILCRPTHPNVTVSLIDGKQKPVSSLKWTFQRREGVVVSSIPHVNGPSFVYCKAEMAGVEPESTFVVVTYEGDLLY